MRHNENSGFAVVRCALMARLLVHYSCGYIVKEKKHLSTSEKFKAGLHAVLFWCRFRYRNNIQATFAHTLISIYFLLSMFDLCQDFSHALTQYT